jgi:hypothetical protein
LNNFELVGINISDLDTAVSSNLSMIYETISQPIITGLINVAQQKMADDIIAWANGGFKGQPLIISNPEKYINDAGLKEAKLALSKIPSDSIYGDSIFSALVDEYKDIDLGTELASLSKSEIPSILQENICSDEELTSLALEEVQNDDGTYSDTDLADKKAELYEYVCEGDPNTDPEVAAKLSDLNEQRPSLSGWDGWLALTGGENPYTKKELAQNKIEDKVEKEKEIKTKEVYDGASAVSQTYCDEYAPVETEGEEPVCISESTLTPGDAVASALERAANSGIDRLTNLTGEGLSGLITTIALQKLTGGLNTAFKVTLSDGGANIGVITRTTSAPKQDLAGNPDTKAQILSPMTKQFDTYVEKLDRLEVTDRDYLIAVNAYENKITEGRSCYDSLVASGAMSPEDSRIVEAYSFYDNRQNKVDAIKGVIVPEMNLIAEAKNFVTTTKNRVNASNSTQEISTIFSDYSAAIISRKYPEPQTEATRRGQYLKDSADARNDKQIDTYLTTCNSMGGTGISPGGI